MSEQIRSIRITLDVDTTKRTITHFIEADSIEEALSLVRDDLADIGWSL